MSNFNDTFGLQVYINLDKRKDRDEQVKQEFSKLGINPIRKSGFIPVGIESSWWTGAVGCMISHMQIIQSALLLNTSVFIFEDDIFFNNEHALNTLNMACNELKDVEWDFLYASGNILKPFQQVSPHLAKLNHIQSTCAYGINKNFLQIVLDNIHLDKIDRPIDVIYSDMAPNHNFYITVPMCGIQRDSFSDIEGTNVNYSSYLEKRYNENLIKL
jgi:GR25 family glycosyltransferase involved in LPS biosynthesis